ncbi:MAG: hypothetical protein DRQ39_06085 [Gammaproteobacteria bacterium]|nr:MAG: hypothetical protein DRQ39_06085 [Gammaproteobacteria bacterium]RKZ94580.1 MAG: hypothetical protein DRQ40_05545 [Gammaproteobacteria bacterium]RKZ97267.1 MAG: hypothetical protein DRQ46_05385 [Gammaproteobacteria bacterium]RLA00893.1 MAG: hypothetical protein DRQ42_04490 [Gammaproteobacteria bacterium]HHA19309.1 SlyX family protein [Methylophaga sp.]
MDNIIVDLQMKLSFQDGLLEELNQVVTDQQQQISRLELTLETLKVQVQTMQTTQLVSEPNEPPPPHY